MKSIILQKHSRRAGYLFNKFYHSRTGRALPLAQRKISFILTTRCNFRCPHCFRQEQDDDKKIKRDLSPQLFEGILTAGRKLLKIDHLSLTGGEPILHPEFEKILKLTKRHGYHYGFASNGFLFKDYWRLIKKIDCRPSYASFSLDGATAETHDQVRNQTGSFSRVIQAIRLFRANGIPVGVNCCLNKYNHRQMEDIAFLCRKLNVTLLRFLGHLPAGGRQFLAERERNEAKLKVVELQKTIKALPFVRFAACLSMQHPTEDFFCGHLSGCLLTVDPWGGLSFCIDIYKNIPTRPLIPKVGFWGALIRHLETIELFQQQRARDLRRNKQLDGLNDCRYCNRYLTSISRRARDKWN